ncbi:MAG: amidophosphoribosyltransferase [Rickettsiales bacterium]|jgi:amidophosphoribosyltransferase|nr:amidophosphoribosyltransferase [Rickettsiales bacterium]
MSGLNEECGVFGIFNTEDASVYTVLGLHALQHRGQEGAGVVTTDGNKFYTHFENGHVGDNFNKPSVLNELPGNTAIGHVRYSTVAEKNSRDFQPLVADFGFGKLALAHNGNLTNADTLRKELVDSGSIFSTSIDSEVIIHLIARSKKTDPLDKILDAFGKIEGAFAVLILLKDQVIAIRDPHGIRPLSLGKLKDSYVLASESCAFDIISASHVRDIKPGEVLIIDQSGQRSIYPFEAKPSKLCIFEYIYFSRPDSVVDGKHVYGIRKEIGRVLARESRVKADIVVPVPDSGVASAIGYSEESGIPFEFGIIRNHYVGRTFIEPSDSVRNLGVKLKHNANAHTIRGKSVLLVDDSLVRGTTSKKIVELVRAAGATEVHLCIASPPTTNSCFYGVDTPDKSKLLAAQHDIEEMRNIVGADSLKFISLDGLYQSVSGYKKGDESGETYCDACFSGEYPIAINS